MKNSLLLILLLCISIAIANSKSGNKIRSKFNSKHKAGLKLKTLADSK
jgi:hypothetical protein